ncbi:hypothetical protein DEU56DRAFT_197005 [Suillus clintonianus]|uniref:uncharacterized protein n=1 Tax=Suillus clintonianus TaxID=1904413 RepID=UPI001B872254|nr:uncharacterized protein DEU56DRAFT_197005 [Suillus clintonianus]KAG2145205.1 hypothetical protein DEU56DRAFT_197005 [Suillus clintonianus]
MPQFSSGAPVAPALSTSFRPKMSSFVGRIVLDLYQTRRRRHRRIRLNQPTAEVFEGHTDLVKEFVWRMRVLKGGEYQLITWSKDRTLRLRPVNAETMEKVGHTASTQAPKCPHLQCSRFFTDESFRHPPTASDATRHFYQHLLGLAEFWLKGKDHNLVLQPHHGFAARARGALLPSGHSWFQHIFGVPTMMTMTCGYARYGRAASMDAFQWLSSIKHTHHSHIQLQFLHAQ